MSDCYVYHRVAAGHERAARRALQAMLAELEAGAQIVGRAFRGAGEPLSWMEVYTAVADQDALAELRGVMAERNGLTACLAGDRQRRVEHFLPLTLQ